MNVRLRSSSGSSVVLPQSVPSRFSVVLTKKTEDRDAEYLVSGFADEGVRWSDQVTSPSSGLESVTGTLRPGTDGTLSPSDFEYVGPVGPYGTLFSSDPDSVGMLACLGRGSRLILILLRPVGPAVPV